MLLAASAACAAFPDGAPWDAIARGGCSECHFGRAPAPESAALALDGLPQRVRAGQRYRLELRLRVDDMAGAGFLLAAFADGAPAGRFESVDARTDTRGGLARHTREGTTLTAHGEAAWRVDWHAPAKLAGTLRFEVWANASDDDRSPLGDRIHRRSWNVAAGAP